MRNILVCVIPLLCLGIISSCEYNNEEELYPMQTCDTTQVNYHETIATIIMQNCFDCHSMVTAPQVSGIPLEGYANLKAMVDAQRLVGALRHSVGFSPMPKDRQQLPECDILKIEQWVNEGAPNN